MHSLEQARPHAHAIKRAQGRRGRSAEGLEAQVADLRDASTTRLDRSLGRGGCTAREQTRAKPGARQARRSLDRAHDESTTMHQAQDVGQLPSVRPKKGPRWSNGVGARTLSEQSANQRT